MTAVLIVLMVIALASLLKGAEYMLTPKAIRKYKPHYVRELEKRELGEAVTTCGKDNCKVCNPAPAMDRIQPRALPKPPSRPVKKFAACGTCGMRLGDNKRATCQKCSFEILTKRNAQARKELAGINRKSEELKRKTKEVTESFKPRIRYVEHEGRHYKAHMPSEVPDNAHAEVVKTYKHGDFFGTWIEFKWTDYRSGKQMGLRAGAFEVDRHEVVRGDDVVVKKFYA